MPRTPAQSKAVPGAVLPKEYGAWIAAVSGDYRRSQIKAALSVNVEMLRFYWRLGADIRRREKDQPWGSKFMQRLSADLRRENPDASCFSVTNLRYIRYFNELYSSLPICRQLADKFEKDKICRQAADKSPSRISGSVDASLPDDIFRIPWGHHQKLIDKFLARPEIALFYVRETLRNNWSRSSLEHWIAAGLHLRQGRAVTNFRTVLPRPDGDLAEEMLKDPYDFSFVPFAQRYREQELKAALLANIESYLLELGQGFSFLGREFKLQMGNETRAADMVFYNLVRRCYVVVEVKVRKFEPADIGQLGAYMVAVNKRLRRTDDTPTIGLLICSERDRVTAQYALESSTQPIGVAEYTLEKFVPDEFRSALPPVEEIEEELTRGLRALPPPQRPKRKARSKTPAAATPPRERKSR